MTYKDLKRQIFNLGFEDSSTYDEEPSIIPDAINLAMRDITNIFPLIDKYEIAQYPLKSLLSSPLYNQDIKHYDGIVPVKYSATGAKSLYFECSGTGTLTITDNNGTRVIELASDRAYKEYREFVSGNVTLTFGGNYSYDIKNIAVYGELYSDKLEDIPAYRQYVRYDFRELTKQDGRYVFIDFLDKVQEGNYSDGFSYKHIQDFQREQPWTIILNGFEKVQYTIFYKKTFVLFDVATQDSFEIELPFDQQHLLPLLSAYYIWLDDDMAKAIMYYNKYEESRNVLLGNVKDTVATVESMGDL